jgi:hypothetical protein
MFGNRFNGLLAPEELKTVETVSGSLGGSVSPG